MKEILIKSTVIGATTLGSALLLKKLYKITNFYPPEPVFWFFMGFNANLVLGLAEKYLSLPETARKAIA